MSLPIPDKSVPISDQDRMMIQAWYDYLKFLPPALLAAVQADQEAGTSNTVAVTPGRQQFHPSAAKAWVYCNAAGAILSSYAIAGVSRSSAGVFVITHGTAFSTANYSAIITIHGASGGVIGVVNAKATGSTTIFTLNTSLSGADPSTGFDVVFYGDQ